MQMILHVSKIPLIHQKKSFWNTQFRRSHFEKFKAFSTGLIIASFEPLLTHQRNTRCHEKIINVCIISQAVMSDNKNFGNDDTKIFSWVLGNLRRLTIPFSLAMIRRCGNYKSISFPNPNRERSKAQTWPFPEDFSFTQKQTSGGTKIFWNILNASSKITHDLLPLSQRLHLGLKDNFGHSSMGNSPVFSFKKARIFIGIKNL